MILTASELDGVSEHADWSYWIGRTRAPASVDHGIEPQRWSEDLALISAQGATEVVLTAEWARLEPEPGHHDPVVIGLTRSIIDEARQAGLAVWLCLLDGTAPGWFTYDEHGFSDSHARRLIWPRHVEWIGETFGDVVDGWIPIREPAHLAVRSRYLDMAPPGGTDSVKGAEAVRDLALAEAEAWRVLRGSSPVATHQTVRVFSGEGRNVRAASHAQDWERLVNQPWVRGLVDGRLEVGDLPGRDVPLLRDAFDQVILQIRPPIVLDGEGNWTPWPIGDRIDAMLDGLDGLRGALGERPVVAAADLGAFENSPQGAADALNELVSATDDMGLDGWFQTSPIDGWHWEAGEDLSPGIIDRDRRPKPAARFFAAGS